jgi:peptide/nickel transport system substrate-binding protein
MRTHGRPIAARGRRLLVALALGAGVALSGGLTMNASGGVRTEAGGAVTSPFVLNMSVGPATLDPAEDCGFSDITIAENTYMRLTRYGSKPGPNGTTQVDPGHIVPYFADSWTITKGGTVYTFKLHPAASRSTRRP